MADSKTGVQEVQEVPRMAYCANSKVGPENLGNILKTKSKTKTEEKPSQGGLTSQIQYKSNKITDYYTLNTIGINKFILIELK